MKKNIIMLILMICCVCGAKAQYVVYNYGSEMGISMDPFGVGEVVVVRDFPCMANLTQGSWIPMELPRVAYQNFLYERRTMGYVMAFSRMKNEVARGMQILSDLFPKASKASKKSSKVSKKQREADKKKAVQQYHERRAGSTVVNKNTTSPGFKLEKVDSNQINVEMDFSNGGL